MSFGDVIMLLGVSFFFFFNIVWYLLGRSYGDREERGKTREGGAEEERGDYLCGGLFPQMAATAKDGPGQN